MTFYLEEVNNYTEKAEFYCPEKEIGYSVDVSGIFCDPNEEPTDAEFEAFCERCDSAFCEAFGDGVDWRF